MSTFYLIRHANTDLVGNTLAGRMPGVPLNAEGIEQAQKLAAKMAALPIKRIYSSPLERARSTAQPLAAALDLKVVISEQLDEIDFGAWTGLRVAELESAPHWKEFNSFRSGTRIPNGEMMLEAQTRVVAFIQDLAQQFPQDEIALVSHADVIRSALAFHLGSSLDFMLRLEIVPASVSAVRLEPYGPQVLYINRSET